MKKLQNLKWSMYISIILSLVSTSLILYSALASHNYCNYFCKDFETCGGIGSCSNIKILDPFIILSSIFIIIALIITVISYIVLCIVPNKYKDKLIQYYYHKSNIQISLSAGLYTSIILIIMTIISKIISQDFCSMCYGTCTNNVCSMSGYILYLKYFFTFILAIFTLISIYTYIIVKIDKSIINKKQNNQQSI